MDLEGFLNISAQRNRDHVIVEIDSIAEHNFDLFDDATSKIFENLKDGLIAMRQKSTELESQVSNFTEENGGIPTDEDLDIIDKIMDLSFEEHWSVEHLSVLSEMKIVYLFKSLEINIKSLIKIAYPEAKTKEFFQWESILSYFKNKDILISTLDGYNEVNDLRKVNNNIKHNNLIGADINNIKEFSGEAYFTYSNIDSFYNRVKPKIQIFISELGQQIIKDLYVFDDLRIEKISNTYKQRMGDKALEKLAQKLTDGNNSK